MKPRLLIIGASGFVGSRWAQAAANAFQVFRGSRRAGSETHAIPVDITDPASVARAFEQARPDYVTLLAAMSDIDRAERERDLAEAINYHGAVNVACQCAERRIRMLFTSTDAVFDGTLGIYHELDPPTPLNWYGQTKARAERAVAELLPQSQIVRLSLVLGTSALSGGNSYLEKVRTNLAAGHPIVSPTFEYRNPIDVDTLCEFLLELTPQADATGIFHIGASDKMSRYDLARGIAQRLGANVDLIVPQQQPVPGRAPRGRDDFLAAERLRAVCRTPLPSCREVIERACHEFA